MDIFELAYKIVGQGTSEAKAGLDAIDAAGQRAAETLTANEAASQRLASARKALAAATHDNVITDEELAAQEKYLAALGIQVASTTASTAPGLGTFNQQVTRLVPNSLSAYRGIYQLDRGFTAMAASAIGAQGGLVGVTSGLALMSGAGAKVLAILAPLAAALELGKAAWDLYATAENETTSAMERAAAKADAMHTSLGPLEDQLEALAAATVLLGEQQDKLKWLQALLPGGVGAAHPVTGGLVGGGALGAIAGPLGSLIGMYQVLTQLQKTQAEVDKRQQEVDNAGVSTTANRSRQLATEIGLYSERIRLGTLDEAGQRRLTQLLRQAAEVRARDDASTADQNRLDQARQGVLDAQAAAQRKVTEEEKKRTQAVRDQQEALIRQASLAEQTLSVLGQTPERIGALRVALAALTAATSEDNLTRLVNLGLIQQAVQLLDAQKKATQALADATKEAIPGRAAPSFGLGGVTTGAQGGPLTFGPGISLAPAQEAALLPERSLTLPFGQGTLPPLIPGDFFSQAVKTLGDGFAKVRQKTALEVRTTMADTVPRFIDFGNVLRATLTGALQGIGDALGELIAGLITGATSAIGGFGRAILATLGDAIASFGKALIALGIQIEAAKAFALALGGFGLIGVGLALVAIGGAIGGVARAAQTAFGGTGGAGGTSPSTTPIRVVVVDTSLGAAGRVRQPAPFIYAPTNIGVTDPGGQRALAKMGQFAQRRNITGVNRIGT